MNVVDVTTGLSLSGVFVDQCTAITNGTGDCSKTNISVGPLSVVLSLTNYETAYAAVTISSTGPTSLKVAMRPNNAPISFNIFDSRSGLPITANVSIAAGTPVSCVGNCSISVTGFESKAITITSSNYRNATATVAYLGLPVYLNFYLVPVSTLTVNYESASIPPTEVTVTLSGTTYTCTGATSCTISDVPYGFYNVTTSANSGETGTASVYSSSSSTTLS